jgi:hypothetical protein
MLKYMKLPPMKPKRCYTKHPGIIGLGVPAHNVISQYPRVNAMSLKDLC